MGSSLPTSRPTPFDPATHANFSPRSSIEYGIISSVQALPRCLVTYIARRKRVPSRILPRWITVLALLRTSPSSNGRSIRPSRVVENDTAAALLAQSGVGELQAELGLADAGRSDHGGERAGEQPAAKQFVESFDAGGEA